MASVAECERAFATLADRLSTADAGTRGKAAFDRSLSCRLTDLEISFAGQLRDSRLEQIRRVTDPDAERPAQIRLAMTSDDLLRLVDGDLNLGSAWTSGRVKVHGSVFDLLKLRSIF